MYRPSAPSTYLEEVSYCPMSRLAIDDSQAHASTDHSILAALDDFLSATPSAPLPPSPNPSPLSVPHRTPPPSALATQCKRSAQDDDESLDVDLSGISLVRETLGATPLHPPPTKNGRLFSGADGDLAR